MTLTFKLESLDQSQVQVSIATQQRGFDWLDERSGGTMTLTQLMMMMMRMMRVMRVMRVRWTLGGIWRTKHQESHHSALNCRSVLAKGELQFVVVVFFFLNIWDSRNDSSSLQPLNDLTAKPVRKMKNSPLIWTDIQSFLEIFKQNLWT